MSTGPISIPRTPTALPSRASTRKSQKRGSQPLGYDPQKINNELDYLHERVNQVLVEASSISDLAEDGSATLLQAVSAINDILSVLRSAGLIRSE